MCFVGCSALLWSRGVSPPGDGGGFADGGGSARGARPPDRRCGGAGLAPDGGRRGHRLCAPAPVRPSVGSFFARVGVIVNNLAPLALLCLGLAGHGVRERSAGYAFAAGQVALAAMVGGYALGVITAGGAIGARESVQLGQIATGVTAAWLLGWLGVRHLLDPTAPRSDRYGRLLVVQDALVWASHLLWLMPALALLTFSGASASAAPRRR